ncbi:MAG: amidase [Proteobacteria bacterium]|nr:amidase [Pseudomonadota bacterium]
MEELARRSATQLVKTIKTKQISSGELVQYFMERYYRLNPKINAIVATDFDSALKKAQEADTALARGEDWGPLHGLPMTLKDGFETTEFPTTFGSPLFKNYIPAQNGEVVQALVDAGAIIFGKTNLSLFAMDTQSFNDVYGQTNNPWDVTKTPGGSSGGSAAALAAGLTGLDMGYDGGGSIRQPAHFCGVYGHKPTYGIVPLHGSVSSSFRNKTNYTVDLDLVVNGPMARSAQDLSLAMNILAKPPTYQQKAVHIHLPEPRKTKLKDFRVGFWINDPSVPMDIEVGICLQNLLDRLVSEKISLTDEKPDVDLLQCHHLRGYFDVAMQSHLTPQEGIDEISELVKQLNKEDKSFKTIIARTLVGDHREWNIKNQTRALIRQNWEDYFRKFDVLLCPVTTIPAHSHDHTDKFSRTIEVNAQTYDYWETTMPWNALAQVAYLPATVAPIGFTSAGLPVGIQIIGPYLEDHTPIQFAGHLEEIHGSFQLPPGFGD